MKKILYFISLLFLPVILACPVCWAQETSGPEVILKEDTFDAGEVIEGGVIEHEFSFFNAGNRPLAIKDIRKSWACNITYFDRVISPSGEGKINLKVDLKGSNPGPLVKTVTVYTNDPANSKFILTVKAFVRVPIQLSTQKVNLTGSEGSIISRSVKITANEERPLEIESHYLMLTKMVTYQLKVIEEGKIIQIDLTNLPNARGSFKGVLVLKTNYPEKPEIYIPIAGNFKKKTIEKKITR
jgi:hypothetical protein